MSEHHSPSGDRPDRSPDVPSDSEFDSLHPSIPFGMAGITVILERLRDGIEGRGRDFDAPWTESRCRLVAEYLLSLSPEYWMSGEELAYCRRVLAA